MRLDQRSQQALVVIVQNAIDERLADSSEGQNHNKLLEHLQELTNQNELLKEELEETHTLAEKYKKQATEYRQRLEELQQADEKQRKLLLDSGNEQTRQ